MKVIFRIIIHGLILSPLTEEWGFKAAVIVRRIYRTRPIQPFQTVYDRNIKIWVRLNDLLEGQIFFQGIARKDRGEVRLLNTLLRDDSVFFDLGGNVGVITMYAAKRCPLGKVHTFEPVSANVARMQANIALNGFDNVIVNQYAVSNSIGEREIYLLDTNNTGATSLYPDERQGIQEEIVPSIRLDDYVNERNMERINVVKIDIEGAEMDALEGFHKSLSRYRPHVVMEITQELIARAGRDPEEIVRFWHELEYEVFNVGNQGQLEPIRNASQLGTDHNIYCDPGESRSKEPRL